MCGRLHSWRSDPGILTPGSHWLRMVVLMGNPSEGAVNRSCKNYSVYVLKYFLVKKNFLGNY